MRKQFAFYVSFMNDQLLIDTNETGKVIKRFSKHKVYEDGKIIAEINSDRVLAYEERQG